MPRGVYSFCLLCVCLCVCVSVSQHLFFVKDFSRTTFPRNLKYGINDEYDELYCGKEKKEL